MQYWFSLVISYTILFVSGHSLHTTDYLWSPFNKYWFSLVKPQRLLTTSDHPFNKLLITFCQASACTHCLWSPLTQFWWPLVNTYSELMASGHPYTVLITSVQPSNSNDYLWSPFMQYYPVPLASGHPSNSTDGLWTPLTQYWLPMVTPHTFCLFSPLTNYLLPLITPQTVLNTSDPPQLVLIASEHPSNSIDGLWLPLKQYW